MNWDIFFLQHGFNCERIRRWRRALNVCELCWRFLTLSLMVRLAYADVMLFRDDDTHPKPFFGILLHTAHVY